MSRPLRLAHYNGTAPNATAPDKVSFAKLAQRVHVRNVDGANALEISFDAGHTFYKLPINSLPLDFDCLLHFCYVRGVGGTAAFCILTNEG